MRDQLQLNSLNGNRYFMNRKKILVHVETKKDATELLLFARTLAVSLQARVSCVAVMDDIPGYDEHDFIIAKQRRKIELRLAHLANKVFDKGKPEFDIIVTKGDFSKRLLEMTRDLGFDLMVIPVEQFADIKPLLHQLALPVIFFRLNKGAGKELVLPVNLDKSYYKKIQESIDIALLLNANLHVIAYSDARYNEHKYQEKLKDIKLMVEKENITCITSFYSWNLGSEAIMSNVFSILENRILLFDTDDFDKIISDTEIFNLWLSANSILMPSAKKLLQQAAVKTAHSFN